MHDPLVEGYLKRIAKALERIAYAHEVNCVKTMADPDCNDLAVATIKRLAVGESLREIHTSVLNKGQT